MLCDWPLISHGYVCTIVYCRTLVAKQHICMRLICTDASLVMPFFSQVVNIFLLAAKIYAFVTTGSKAVAASLADSGVDILSQAILALMQHLMNTKHDDYPVGRHRLEALGVIACSCIMSMSSLEVIQFSFKGRHKYI